MKTLIHMGIELIVIGGITYWLNRKINGAEVRITEQQAQIAALQEVVKKQGETIAKHNELLQRIVDFIESGGLAHQQAAPQQTRPQQMRAAVPKVQPRPVAKAVQTPPQRMTLPAPSVMTAPPVIEQPDVAPEQLDQLLEQELQSMSGSSEAEAESEGIEIECHGDVCLIKDTSKSVSGAAKAKSKKKVSAKRNV